MSDTSLRPAAEKARRFVFLLLRDFTLMPFSSALDALRIANRYDNTERYTWKIVSENGEPVTCSNGLTIMPDMGLEELSRDDIVMVCGGIGIDRTSTKNVLNWLRREARRGVSIGGVCTGAYTTVSYTHLTLPTKA